MKAVPPGDARSVNLFRFAGDMIGIALLHDRLVFSGGDILPPLLRVGEGFDGFRGLGFLFCSHDFNHEWTRMDTNFGGERTGYAS